MTVLAAIENSVRFLEGKGVESPRLNAEWLLAHVLNLPRLELFLNAKRTLSPAELEAFQKLVERRGRREPLQHILGTSNFCGLELWVTPDVLVPRPETELLAEKAVAFLHECVGGDSRKTPVAADVSRLQSKSESVEEVSLLTSAASNKLVLDIGTGSGCLPIFIAHEVPEARVTSVDISPGALTVARENARRVGVADRIDFLEGNAFEALSPDKRFDLIVSNPPYIPSGEIGQLEPEVRDFDPRLALDGGSDGLEFYRRIAIQAADRLKSGGRLMLELGHDQAAAVTEILERQMWIVEAVVPDYSRVPRILIARRG